QRYLEIMQIRFQGRLVVEMDIEPEARTALVPNFILQPLVENAIKHGVSKMDDAGRIEIYARRSGERLVLGVRDNGPPLDAHKSSSEEGVGLRNSRARLAQLYGSSQSLDLFPVEGGGVVAEVSIPYHTGADLRTTSVAVNA